MRAGRLLACLLGLGLAACGEDTAQPGPAAPGTSSPQAKKPLCAELWVDGQALPDHYKGCSDAHGTWVKAEAQRFDSGQVLVTYADRFYGAMGAVVNDVGGPLADDPHYQRASRSCG